MRSLGHERYLVAGGDWGASIAVRLAHAYPEAVQALHLYMMPLRRPETWPESEIASRAALERWLEEEGGYVHIQGTRPQTLAYGLQDSPVGLMSWIAEKFDRWTDARGVPDDDLLTTVMIYWVTGSIGSSFWPYWARRHGDWVLDDVAAHGGRLRRAADLPRLPEGDRARPARGRRARVFDIERWDDAGVRRALPGAGGHGRARRQPDRASAADSEDLQLAHAARRLELRPCPPPRPPTSALPTGESIDSLPSPGAASGADDERVVGLLARTSASSTSTRLPNPTTSVCVSTSRTSACQQLLADAEDLRLQVRLVVLGVVVLGVLLEIAPLARGLDALGDLPPGDGLQLLELGLQRPSAPRRS